MNHCICRLRINLKNKTIMIR
ncbi:MAG: hypothetical protein LCH91_05195 [Bacteroidetes bacterium]|nr:hypothetical protein [Bacteroidota bacterium]